MRRSASRALAFLLWGFALLAPAASQQPSQTAIDLIQNRWAPTQYVYVEAGFPAAGSAPPSAANAQWAIEATGEPTVIRLRNMATSQYLHADGGRLQVGPLTAPDMPAAGWSIDSVPGIDDARLRNTATGGYLHTKDGPLTLGDAPADWQESFWKFIPVSGAQPPAIRRYVATGAVAAAAIAAVAASRPAKSVPKPDDWRGDRKPEPEPKSCKAKGGKWLWVNDRQICVQGCPRGTRQEVRSYGLTCVSDKGTGSGCPPGYRSENGKCFRSCPSGQTLHDAKCVCDAGTHFVGNRCVADKADPKPKKAEPTPKADTKKDTKDTTKKDTTKKDTTKKDTTKKDTTRKDTSKKDTSKKDTSKKDTSKKDTKKDPKKAA
jgi:hypothetical protein